MIFFLVSNSPVSVISFRVDMIKAIQSNEHQVYVACPGMGADAAERLLLQELGVQVYDIPMSRTVIPPFITEAISRAH